MAPGRPRDAGARSSRGGARARWGRPTRGASGRRRAARAPNARAAMRGARRSRATAPARGAARTSTRRECSRAHDRHNDSTRQSPLHPSIRRPGRRRVPAVVRAALENARLPSRSARPRPEDRVAAERDHRVPTEKRPINAPPPTRLRRFGIGVPKFRRPSGPSLVGAEGSRCWDERAPRARARPRRRSGDDGRGDARADGGGADDRGATHRVKGKAAKKKVRAARASPRARSSDVSPRQRLSSLARSMPPPPLAADLCPFLPELFTPESLIAQTLRTMVASLPFVVTLRKMSRRRGVRRWFTTAALFAGVLLTYAFVLIPTASCGGCAGGAFTGGAFGFAFLILAGARKVFSPAPSRTISRWARSWRSSPRRTPPAVRSSSASTPTRSRRTGTWARASSPRRRSSRWRTPRAPLGLGRSR